MKKSGFIVIGIVIGLAICTAIVIPIEEIRIRREINVERVIDIVEFSANTTTENFEHLFLDTIDKRGFHWYRIYFTIGNGFCDFLNLSLNIDEFKDDYTKYHMVIEGFYNEVDHVHSILLYYSVSIDDSPIYHNFDPYIFSGFEITLYNRDIVNWWKFKSNTTLLDWHI